MRKTLFALLILVTGALAGTAAPVAAQGRDAPMAVGLSGVRDWSTQQPFIDVMKTARRWIGHKPGQWGGVHFDELEARGILDENGWPTSVPHDLSSIGTLILTDLPSDAEAYAGRYRLRFEGDGIIEVSGRAENVRYGRNEVRFDFTPGEGFVMLRIQRTDRRRTGDYLRNVSVVKLEHEKRWQAGEVFNPRWLAHLEGFGILRFMDWMNTNDSKQGDWTTRPRVADFSYTRYGVPIEVMIDLANRLGADPWFNIPHLADDRYVRAFAELTRQRLDPDLRAHVEFSNEVWNWQFDQTHWADRKAMARWGVEHQGVQYYALRATEVARIWSDVFAADPARLVNVIATQTGWLGLEHLILEAPLWVKEDPARNRPPADHFDAYAVTGYFGGALGTDDLVGTVRRWIAQSREEARQQAEAKGLAGEALDSYVTAHRYDAAVQRAARELADGSETGEPEQSVADLLDRVLPYHADIAREHGLDLVMYEGGTHVVGIGPHVNDRDLTEFFIHLNYSPEMGDLYRRLMAGWEDLGGRAFNVFVDVKKPGKWGSWGHLRHLGDENPRWTAVTEFR